ncbi:MAG: class I SAM-dependent methyltransferase [Ardenticatenaceae bacterium]|nr:class I SAM-dependent methyltransferase [Anaerolineales bacterium]MCB8921359.1 class I SAM-dependent methyltransferase [Ardenticatenaceae bacterium]MCB9004017.1 class I SAM-dependent methyltransferase [Ardenticatenaceae bacterium]
MSNHNGNGHYLQLPPIGERRIALRVSSAAERAIRRGHPWLFAQAIERQSHQGAPGDFAVIFDRKGRFLAVGLYDPTAPLRVRILHMGTPLTIDAAWFRARLLGAFAHRQSLMDDPQTNGYRLVHGENDGLPGLVIDRYADTCVLKLDTPAWIPHLNEVLAVLLETAVPQRIMLRLSRSVQELGDALYGLKDGVVLYGEPLRDPVIFLENGLQFEVDVRLGQKTGFFLDQRDNRARVEKLAADKRVLNVFAYTGGFSLYAARGAAREVVSLDISQPALAAAGRNFKLNQHIPAVAAASHELLLGDAFRAMEQLRDSHRKFDMVVIDPPSFASKRADVPGALGAYQRLVRLGLSVLRGGGTLVMASCSSRVTADAFFAAVHEAAVMGGRPLQEIERTFHAIDHPIGFKEGAYLKCLFAIAN